MVPDSVPLALLVVLEAAALVASILAHVRGGSSVRTLRLCARCSRLHTRSEAFGRVADAVAVGALAFLVALPFVAAGYESGFTLGRAALATSAVIAVLAVAAEADFLVRALAARLWPRFTWNVEPTRVIGGGARWLGVLLAGYVLEPRDAGVAALFDGVGRRLALDLSSTWIITAAAVILVLAAAVSFAARWLVPLVCNSLPTTFAPRNPHGTPV